MNMSGDIRVRTDKRHKTVYNDLKNYAFKEMHEVFFLCACLGYLRKEKRSLGRNGEDRFWSSTITPEEYACFYAIVVESNDMDFSAIRDDNQVIATMEEYANAGMQVLLDEVLSDYLLRSGTDIRLDPTCIEEMPKIILSYVYEKAAE